MASGVRRSVVIGEQARTSPPKKRADAQRNEQVLLDAAAAAFVRSGVGVPVRTIAAEAGVGVGTIYRHFPTRADLIAAVYRHQVEACAAAGPVLLAESDSPYPALARWVDLFVDFLVTKHGLAEAMNSGGAAYENLHASFLDRLLPVVAELIGAAVEAGEIAEIGALELLFGIGNLCAGAGKVDGYDARRMVGFLIDGLGVR
ncbi:TetR/AcrR family transcriptional regulator [Nocardia callitridis]|uniref:TetR/AcrR family transcriptional regulator n=1 Tax=Nocardia callitridis TaxID=648753 RepID=UPI003CD0C0DD